MSPSSQSLEPPGIPGWFNQRQLDELEEKENGLLDLRLSNTLDDETFQRQLARIRADRKRSFALLQDAQRQIDGAYLVVAQKVLNVAKSAKALWETRSREERRDFLSKLLLNPLLDGKTVRYDLKMPYAVLSEMKQMEDWRALQDSNLRPSA